MIRQAIRGGLQCLATHAVTIRHLADNEVAVAGCDPGDAGMLPPAGLAPDADDIAVVSFGFRARTPRGPAMCQSSLIN